MIFSKCLFVTVTHSLKKKTTRFNICNFDRTVIRLYQGIKGSTPTESFFLIIIIYNKVSS